MLKLCWGGLADGGGDFCRARTLSPSSPTKCPDRGAVLGPMLGHLEAMVGHVGLCRGIFVGHEPSHLRAPQYAQIGGLFLGQCWAIWKRCWPKMAVHVGHPVHFGNLDAKKTPY